MGSSISVARDANMAETLFPCWSISSSTSTDTGQTAISGLLGQGIVEHQVAAKRPRTDSEDDVVDLDVEGVLDRTCLVEGDAGERRWRGPGRSTG